MKSIFILGASRLQIPAIKKAKEKGLFVYVLDYDPNAEGIKYADVFLEISTIDREAVLKKAIECCPDYIITSTSDMPVRTVSWVCEQLGKKTDISYQGAIFATNKIEMRKRMRECNVPIPIFHELNSYEEFLDIFNEMPPKFVLKPADNAASRGVILIDKSQSNNLEDIYNFCSSYSRDGGIIAEEFMDGPEVSVEAYSIKGEPHIITITDKLVSEEPFFVELGHTEPSRLPLDKQKEIISVADSAIRAIGMIDGPTHTEIKVTSKGVKLVEIAARLGGDFITSKLVPLSTGIDLIESSFCTLLGEEVDLMPSKNRGSAIRFLHGKKGIIKSISIDEAFDNNANIEEICFYKEVGESVNDLQNSSDRLGHVITVGSNAEEAAKIADEVVSKIKIIIE